MHYHVSLGTAYDQKFKYNVGIRDKGNKLI